MRNLKIFKLIKSQNLVKLSIHNSQLSKNKNIGMNIRHINHVNTYILFLSISNLKYQKIIQNIILKTSLHI
jgi:hypothetical protein